MAKRKISPLQRWKAQYAFVSEHIKQVKAATRKGGGKLQWGSFKQSTKQCHLAMLRAAAAKLLSERHIAVQESHRLWLERARSWRKHNQTELQAQPL